MRKITFHNIARKRNLKSEMRAFLTGKKAYPNLKLSFRHDAEQVESFIEYISNEDQKLQYNLVLASSKADVESYRELMEQKYTAPKLKDFKKVLGYLKERAQDTEQQDEFDKLMSEIDVRRVSKSLDIPDENEFKHYRELFLEIFSEEIAVIRKHVQKGQSFEKAMSNIAKDLKLDKQGWEVGAASRGNSLYVLGKKRKILVPKGKKIEQTLRARRVFAHEILIHVNRRNKGLETHQNEEALGVLAEQLMRTRYTHKRTVRYLAASLAWGVDGHRRDFRQTYELVRRAIQIIDGKSDDNKISRRAFNETARVFSGGHPEIPGFVLLKDTIYLSSNIALWEKLRNNLLTKAEFKKILTGVIK